MVSRVLNPDLFLSLITLNYTYSPFAGAKSENCLGFFHRQPRLAESPRQNLQWTNFRPHHARSASFSFDTLRKVKTLPRLQ